MNKVIGNGRGSVEKPFGTSGNTGTVATDASISGTAASATTGGVPTGAASALVPQMDGKLRIRRETLARPAGVEQDATADTRPATRTPGGMEWIKIMPDPQQIFETNMLAYKPSRESQESLHYIIDQALRDHHRIARFMKLIRFYLCFSLAERSFFLWPIKVVDMVQYHSLDAHLRQPPEYFVKNALNFCWDHALKRHIVNVDPDPTPVRWPEKDMEDIVSDALGLDAIIRDASHPVIASLTRGTEMR